MSDSVLSRILSTKPEEIAQEWLAELRAAGVRRDDLMREGELQSQMAELIHLLGAAAAAGTTDIQSPVFNEVRQMLASVSRSRAQQGFSPRDTALFVFAIKRPLFERLAASGGEAGDIVKATWEMSALLDGLGLYTIESYMKTREEVILRQQQELLELSTPVVKLWDGILALPMIGTLDSQRTQVVMESLLQKIVETGSQIAILDITGVPTVDTLVAQHLMKTVAAARLMGAECIISGIRPQIAQTIVHLGVDLKDVTTKASLADAFVVALQRSGASLEVPRGR
jgi:rsbT co-antagonist protein RsbR